MIVHRAASRGTPASVHLVTGEFPPQFGGVADYTQSVARALAVRRVPVHVWCPAAPGLEAADPVGVVVHRSAGAWRRADFDRIDRELDATPAPRRLIVQWVPHAFGRRSLNVGFCAWIRRRGLAGDRIDLMVHEACFAFGEGGVKQNIAAGVHRVMLALLLSRAHRVWISIPAWASRLRPCTLGRRLAFEWLPVPSNVPVVDDAAAVHARRTALGAAGADAVVAGHFGTYDSQARRALSSLVPALLARSRSVTMQLIGRDSDGFRASLAATHPQLASRIHATGTIDGRGLSLALQACDVMVQPYPDGASSRRGTLMASLAHGIAVVTTDGRLSEPLWRESHAVCTVRAGNEAAMLDATAALCADPVERHRLALAGRSLYATRFDLATTVDALLAEAPAS